EAILRALRTHCPNVRRTVGSSFGPITINATTPMRRNSLHPMSNIKASAYAQRPTPLRRTRGRPASVLGASGSDSLAANVRTRRRRRGAGVFDGLHRLGLFGGGVVLLHALLEGLDALSDVTHQVGHLAAPEQQQDDDDHQHPVPNAKRTHPATSKTPNGRSPA